VVSDVPGCRQFVRPEVEGLVVPPGNARALADALATLAGDRQSQVRAGAAARRKIVREYTEAAVRAKVRDVYRAARAGAGVRPSGSDTVAPSAVAYGVRPRGSDT
jgi:glycosyltransferase involved in cell wall biosynthesis